MKERLGRCKAVELITICRREKSDSPLGAQVFAIQALSRGENVALAKPGPCGRVEVRTEVPVKTYSGANIDRRSKLLSFPY
jgi:hypothetical protein